MFAAIARSYDMNNRLHSLWRDQAWRKKAVEFCGVKRTDDVLDVACGTGDLSEAFALARPASVLGVDFTEPMLEIAKAKAAQRRRPEGQPKPTFQHADAMALPFEKRSFDIVSIAFGIRNVTDPAKALTEFRRVMRPGGRLLILEFSRPRNPVLRFLNGIYCNRIMPITASWLAGDRTGAYRYLPRSVATFLSRSAMIDMMERAGFKSTTANAFTGGICVAYVGRDAVS